MAYMYTVQWGMEEIAINMSPEGTSLVVQWLRLHGSNAGGAGLIPGQGTKIPHAVQPKIFKKIEKERNNCKNYIQLEKKLK